MRNVEIAMHLIGCIIRCVKTNQSSVIYFNAEGKTIVQLQYERGEEEKTLENMFPEIEEYIVGQIFRNNINQRIGVSLLNISNEGIEDSNIELKIHLHNKGERVYLKIRKL